MRVTDERQAEVPRSLRLKPGESGALPVDRMLPCPTQGPTRMERVDWLAAHWHEGSLRPLRVYRRDGRWFIRNGRHRWLAAKRLGIAELPVDVVEGPARPWWGSTLRWWTHDDDPHPRSGYGSLGAMNGLAPKYEVYRRENESRTRGSSPG